MCLLYPFDRATTSKEGLHSPLKEVKKKKSDRENGEREGCRSASRSHGIRQNLELNFPAFIEKKNCGDEILITLPQAKIGFRRASQRKEALR